jgi:plastocyanin
MLIVAAALALVPLLSAAQPAHAGMLPEDANAGGLLQGTNEQLVEIRGFAFNPGVLRVSVGTTVVWTNQNGATHTVTADAGAFDSGQLGQGQSYSFTFDSVGTFNYHCELHPAMQGTIEVVAGEVEAPAVPEVSEAAPAQQYGADGGTYGSQGKATGSYYAPGYGGAQMGYTPVYPFYPKPKPLFRPIYPVYPKAKPLYRPVYPVYPKAKPLYRPIYPVYPKAKPLYRPIYPVYPKAKPLYRPIYPVYPKVKPYFRPLYPVFPKARPFYTPCQWCRRY